MNKKYISIIVGAFLLLGTNSCSDYLDQVPTDIETLEKTYETRDRVLQNLASVYVHMPSQNEDRWPGVGDTNSQFTPGAWDAGCDDAEFVWATNGTHEINNGSLTPESPMLIAFWDKWYKGIRTSTLFMENIHICKVLEKGDLEQWTAEARACRAIYYYYLLRTFGPVPIIDTPISEQVPVSELNATRSSVEEMVNYILSELDKSIAEGLVPNIKQSSYMTDRYKGFGHIDQVIARAFKVQVRMLAASDLFNGSNSYFANLQNPDGKKLFPSYSDAEKKQLWASAATEARNFINDYAQKGYDLTRKYTNGKLDPYLSYREAIRGATSELTNLDGTTSAVEMIWFNKSGSTGVMHYNRTPKHIGYNETVRCSGGMAATQESVDAYFMANGLKPIIGYESDGKTPVINNASGYKDDFSPSTADYIDPVTGRVLAPRGVAQSWTNREPRFYADITFDGQKWLYEGAGVIYSQLQYSGNSGRGSGNANDYAKTGYVVRKSAPITVWANDDRVSIMLRMANIYLDYAEALNESSPGDADIIKYLNLIRERAGIPQYGAASGQINIGNSQDKVREAIRNERRVELAFENSRYFDVRRWCTAEDKNSLDYQGKAIYGMNIEKDGPEFFVRTKVEDRFFEKKCYFFPLPLKDLLINKNLVQNPGW